MLKRSFDLAVSSLLIIFLAPILLVVSLVILLTMGRPIFFIQRRLGYKGQLFNVIKFRTMNNIKSNDGSLLEDSKRLTSIGKFLRNTSIDELPQFINVLRGDISLVGPRPLLPEYQPLYSKRQWQRHNVMPGITGWAQINGRNAINWKMRFELDLWYVEHASFYLDMKIICLTIWKIAKRDGINPPGKATMERFTGNNHD